MSAAVRVSVRKGAHPGVWLAACAEVQPDGRHTACCSASLGTEEAAWAAMPQMVADMRARAPWGPDVRGGASERRNVG